MVREQAGDLLLSAGVAILEPRRCLRMEGAALLDDEGSVRRFLDQRVLEPVLGLGPPAGLAEQVQPHQGRERPVDVRLASDRLQEREPELASEDGGRHQQRARLRLQAVDASEDHLLDGGRDLDLGVVVEAP